MVNTPAVVKASFSTEGERAIEISQVSDPPGLIRKPLILKVGSMKTKTKGLSGSVLVKLLKELTEQVNELEGVPPRIEEPFSELEQIVKDRGVHPFQLPYLNEEEIEFAKEKGVPLPLST